MVVVASALLLTACSRDAGRLTDPDTTTTTEPEISPVRRVKTLDTQAAQVGSPFSLDATMGGTAFVDSSGTGLEYSAWFAPHPNGLMIKDGVISGTPVEPMTMLVQVTAVNQKKGRANLIFLLVAFDSSLATPALPDVPYTYGELPQHVLSLASMMTSDNLPPGTALENDVVALGRVLFYDRRLSVNDRVSCASCHHQEFGFADTARVSRGFAGGQTKRNAMSLSNLRFYKPARFFWDERAETLEQLALMPIQDEVEMGMLLDYLPPKLSVAGYYGPLFQKAFGSPTVTLDGVATALAQFLRSLGSWTARLDEPLLATGDMRAPGFLTAEELRGATLFQDFCFVCHTSVGQVATVARNNGVDSLNTDAGAGGGRFKVPSLRNIAMTAPYMHDGRFRTLAEVVEFYNSAVQASPTLDPALSERVGVPTRLDLSSSDKAAIVAFLRTLTDSSFLSDPRFSDPFPKRN